MTKYETLARDLIRKVRAINPNAKIVKDWEQNPTTVVNLTKSWHKSYGEDFITAPWEYLSPENFK